MSFPKVNGVGRDKDNDKCIIVYLQRPLTDDELRVFHEQVKLFEHEFLGFIPEKLQ